MQTPNIVIQSVLSFSTSDYFLESDCPVPAMKVHQFLVFDALLSKVVFPEIMI